MSSTGPGRPEGWDPDDTGAVPVGPEPEPTGVGGAGSGGWGEAPRTEPFAIAALVWALVSIVLPIVGTIVAFVLAARAADAIRRSRGARSGTNLVNAARVIAGVVIVLWAIGLILFLVLRDGDSDSDDSNVAVPTQPSTVPTTTLPPSTTNTTGPPATTASVAPPTTTQPIAPTTSIVPPPPTEPPTQPPPTTVAPTQPTSPPTTEAPTTTPTTEAPTTTTVKPTQPTTPEQVEAARIENRLLGTSGNPNQRIGPSDRGVPDDERIVVTYVKGETLQVRWAINNGQPPLPEGEPTCTSPPTTSTTTTRPDDGGTTSSTTSSTTTTRPDDDPTTTSVPVSELSTAQLARREARNILNVIRREIQQRRLDIEGVQLVGTYPIEGPDADDVDVVQVFYANDDVTDNWPYQQAFDAPPADQVQCLNPAFAITTSADVSSSDGP